MSFRYSSCFSFSSPNMRSTRTSENPMMALSGVRSSCDMLARNSDLCRLAVSSWALLSAISRKSRAFLDGEDRLAAERLQHVHVGRRELAGRLPIEGQAADDLVLSKQGHGEQGPVTEPDENIPHAALVGPGLGDVGNLYRLAHLRRTAHEPLTLSKARRPRPPSSR